jgi:murein DD-endopeptidase MepM/ murein hydrolase activator NlpD
MPVSPVTVRPFPLPLLRALMLGAALLALAAPGAASGQGTGDAPRDSVARDSVVRDSVSSDSAARRSILRDSIVRDSIVRDSIFRASIVRDSIARDSVVRDSIVRAVVAADSIAVDSATRARRATGAAGVSARRVDSLAAAIERDLERAREEARAAALAAESARRDSIARVHAERLARVRERSAWLPKRPRQGTLVRIVLPELDTAAWRAAGGTFAGEPLHFEPDSGGKLQALAAIPVDARTGSIVASVVLSRVGGESDTLALRIPVDTGNFRSERLKVSRTYGTEPDSALRARIDREYEQAVAVSRRSHERPRLWSGPWVVPREARVTSGFGNAREFNGVVTSRHMGVDYAGPGGSPVRAANRGIVAIVGDFFLGGNVVYIDHGAGLVTAYLHLSRVDVAEGDTVDAGQRIGLVGSTGRSTGPHLHWIARYGRISVDARGLLALPPAPSRKPE